ncbi:hypothetical protein ACRALDRAFT_2111757 [Sodiomyces alcalophilus JCM 7366]|uniref:uncharacterized protein n=1 Tax=Sodiomyces alcalophilus JCM 7366 TaxID=591952 RepID=UPI0039B62777
MLSTGVDQDSQLSPDHSFNSHHQPQQQQQQHPHHHDAPHSNEHWGDMSPYSQNTMPDYSSFHYGSHSPHGLTSESISRMPPPPVPLQPMQPIQPIQPHHQRQPHAHLSMLTIPTQQPAWPSMLTNPNSYSAHSAPPISMPSMVAPTPAKMTRPPGASQSTPRKTLTDDDRRRMCQYHLENPNMKQTEIGAMFGVERSTVSKVLRNKEKYLYPEDRSQSPIKRTKSKIPDIDKAMSSWARRQVRHGSDVSDEEILQQARHFVANVAGDADAHIKAFQNGTWLEKFKQKNGIGVRRLLRRASETNIPDHANMSSTSSPSLGHNTNDNGNSNSNSNSSIIATTSPTVQGPLSPLSAERSDGDTSPGLGFVASLNTAPPTDAGSSSFSSVAAAPLSPTGPFSFSPDPNVGGFLPPADQTRDMQDGGSGGAGSNFQRPRSQTFPTLDLEFVNNNDNSNQPNSNSTAGDPTTPRFQTAASSSATTAPSSALQSPAHELNRNPFAMDTTNVVTAASPHLHRHHNSSSSNGSGGSSTGGRMAGRSTTTCLTSGLSSTPPLGSSPSSPSQEDARRAADTLLSYIQNAASSGFVDHSDYTAVLRLTEKLRLHQFQMQAVSKTSAIGGLTRIPEGDGEMGPLPKVGAAMVE